MAPSGSLAQKKAAGHTIVTSSPGRRLVWAIRESLPYNPAVRPTTVTIIAADAGKSIPAFRLRRSISGSRHPAAMICRRGRQSCGLLNKPLGFQCPFKLQPGFFLIRLISGPSRIEQKLGSTLGHELINGIRTKPLARRVRRDCDAAFCPRGLLSVRIVGVAAPSFRQEVSKWPR